MQKFLDELKTIEERFLSAESGEKGQVDVDEDLEKAGNYSVDGDVLAQEVEEIEGASSEEVNESLFMLLEVITTCIEKMKIILDKADGVDVVDKEMLEMAEDAEDELEEIVNEIGERLEDAELPDDEEEDQEEDQEEAGEEDKEDSEEDVESSEEQSSEGESEEEK